jgi:hypothetical protein
MAAADLVAGGRVLVPAAIHAHSRFSDGTLSPRELAAAAAAAGLGVLCITDHHREEFRWRLGIALSRPSVVAGGAARYLDALAALGRSCGGRPVIVPGIEVMPHYAWSGLPPWLTCTAARTLTAYGVADPAVITALPVVLGARRAPPPETAAQAVIDALAAAGGVVLWSQPEADEAFRFGPATLRFRPAPELLERTSGYAGFGALPAGWASAAPGGRWDRLLAARRGQGPWAFGEADFHGPGHPAPYAALTLAVTVFETPCPDAAAVLAAMRSGACYALAGADPRQVTLDRHAAVAGDGRSAGSGGRLCTDAAAWFECAVGGVGGAAAAGARLRVVAGGRVLHDAPGIAARVALPVPAGAGYAVRALFEAPGGAATGAPPLRLVTNPVWIAPPEGPAR